MPTWLSQLAGCATAAIAVGALLRAWRIGRGTGGRWPVQRSVLAAVAAIALLGAAVNGSYAAFSSTTSNTGDSFAADTLDPASSPLSVHTSTTGGMVTLSWTGSPDSYVAGYRIERATSPNGTYSTIATMPMGTSGITEFSGLASGSQPTGIVTGPDGNVWVTEAGTNKIGKVSSSGTVLAEYTIPTAASSPKGITSGPDGNLWFVESATNKVAKVTTSGTFTEYAITTANSQPNSITTGPDGNLWFTEQNTNKIGKITTSGTVTEYTVPTAASQPFVIRAGPDDELWFTESATNKVGNIKTAGTFNEYTVPTGSSAPKGLAAGPDGKMWYVETSGNKVAKVPPYADTISSTEYSSGITASSQPTGITTGPDGNLWFTELNGNKIARVTTGGTVTEYAVPTSASQPNRIAAGPDGNVWFTETAADKIGRMGLNLSTSYTDTTASFNTQYYYKVYAYYKTWTSAASATDQALSLNPTSGTDGTPASATALTSTNLSAMSLGDNTSFTNGSNWVSNRPFAAANLHGLQMMTSSTGYAFGQSGTILKTTNGAVDWTAQTSGTTNSFEDGWFANANNGWAAGASGTIRGTTNGGSTWSAQTSGTTNNLKGLHAADATHVWAVGASGTILFSDGGGTWSTQTSGTTNNLEDVYALDATHVWAVGASGTVRFFNGTSWSGQTSGVTNNLQGIWFTDANNGWLVGDSGVLRTTTNGGATWTAQTSGVTSKLKGIWFLDSTHGWVSGDNGVILAYNGSSWSPQTSSISADNLWCVSFTDTSNGVATGDDGHGANIELTKDGGTNWIVAAAQELEYVFSPTTAAGAGINTVKATLSYKTSANPGGTTKFWLLASADGGTTWKYYALPAGSTSTTTSTVDLSSLVDTATKLQNLKLRFYVEWGSGFTTNNDVVQLQVN